MAQGSSCLLASLDLMIPIFDGFAPLAERYDGFIVDLWGVMHDGARVFPAAIDCLARLHALDKRIVILSNAPRRVSSIQERNQQLGLSPSLSHAVMSSGEDAWRHLAQRSDAFQGRGTGPRICMCGPLPLAWPGLSKSCPDRMSTLLPRGG